MKGVIYLAIPLFFLHGLEEGLTGIFTIDPFFRYFRDKAVYVLLAELVAIALVLWMAASGKGGRNVQEKGLKVGPIVVFTRLDGDVAYDNAINFGAVGYELLQNGGPEFFSDKIKHYLNNNQPGDPWVTEVLHPKDLPDGDNSLPRANDNI